MLSLIILNKTAHAIEPLSSAREQEKVATCSGQVRFNRERQGVERENEFRETEKGSSYLKTSTSVI